MLPLDVQPENLLELKEEKAGNLPGNFRRNIPINFDVVHDNNEDRKYFERGWLLHHGPDSNDGFCHWCIRPGGGRQGVSLKGEEVGHVCDLRRTLNRPPGVSTPCGGFGVLMHRGGGRVHFRVLPPPHYTSPTFFNGRKSTTGKYRLLVGIYGRCAKIDTSYPTMSRDSNGGGYPPPA